MKRSQTLLLLLSFGCLVSVMCTRFNHMEKEEISNKIENEVLEINRRTLMAKEIYNKQIMNQLTIDEEFVVDLRIILTDTKRLAERGNEIYRCRNFTDMISTLADWHSKLRKKCLKNEVYTEFLENHSKKLLELGKTQIEAWPKIKTALKKYEDEQKKSSCIDEAAALAQSQKDKQYSQKYKEFISDVEEFLQINSMFGKEEDSIDSLMQAYNNHVKNSNLTSERKEEDYTQIIASYLLREKISLIMDLITSPVEDTVKKLDVYNSILHFVPFLFKKATDLERQQYTEDEKFKEIEDMFFSFSKLLKTTTRYDLLKFILDQDRIGFGAHIEQRYYSLMREDILPTYENRESNSWVIFSKGIKQNLSNLVRYNHIIIEMLFKLMHVNNSIYYLHNTNTFVINSINEKTTGLQITAEELSEDDILNWLGIEVSSSPNVYTGANHSPSGSEKMVETVDDGLNGENESITMSEWTKHMQIGLGEDDETRKTYIKSMLQALHNINKIFLVVCKAVTLPEEYKKKYLTLTSKIEFNIELIKGLCYIEKINHLKRSVNCKALPYTLYAAKFMAKLYPNDNCSEYPALNERSYQNFYNLTASSFFLEKNKAYTLLQYLQSLIKQCNEANSKVNFLFKTDDLERQNALARKICGVKVGEKLRPIKTVVATESLNHEIRTAIDNMSNIITYIIQEGIHNRHIFYAIQENVYAFHSAVSALETWTTSDAQDALNAFTEYREKNIRKKIIKLRRIEKEKNIEQLKNDMDACEDTIEHINGSITSSLLTRIHFTVDIVIGFEILYEDIKKPISMVYYTSQGYGNQFESESDDLSMEEIVGIGIVLIIVAVIVYFIIKKIRQRRT